MNEKKVKRSYELDADIAERLDLWVDQTGFKKNVAVQLALWVVMQLKPTARQQYMDEMNTRNETEGDMKALERGGQRTAKLKKRSASGA
jgi:hypothetical protein